MKVLVTGATGSIGSHLVRRLSSGHDVFGLTRRPQAEPAGVQWISSDLSQPLDLSLLPSAVDAVVHLAQSERYRDFPEGAMDVFAVNVQSTAALLEYARRSGARAFILASTGGCYATSTEPVSEDAALATPGPYFRSKRMAELLAENYADRLGGAILRFFFVYGPNGQLLVSRLAKQILAGEEIAVDGDPGMAINPIYVEDAAAAIEAALGLERQATVNVAGAEVVRIGELIERLAHALGRKARVTHRGPAPGDLVADTSRLSDLLGVEPKVSLDEGLAVVAEALAAEERR